MTPATPQVLAAIESARDILTRCEWAYDPDAAIDALSAMPAAIRAIVAALGVESAPVARSEADECAALAFLRAYADTLREPSQGITGGERTTADVE